MNNKSDKMDRQGARTVADLELKFNMGKSFAEVMGITDINRMTLEDAREVITRLQEDLKSITASVEDALDNVEARLVLAIQYDSEGKPYAVISEKADYIELTGERIRISSDHFTLDKNGAWFSGFITAAVIGDGNVQLNDSCLEFYTDAGLKLGSLDSKSTQVGGYIKATGDFRFTDKVNFENEIHLGYDHPIKMNGQNCPSGWLTVKKDLNDSSYLHFINGILVEVSDTKPSGWDENAISRLN